MSPDPLLPSGAQVELAFGDQRAVVTEVGGALRTYTAGGAPVVDGYDAGEMCSGGSGQVLVPWPNRIADGRYRFAGSDHQLPLTEPARGNANHGLVRWAAWTVEEQHPHRAVMGFVLHPQPGYPFTLRVVVDYRLSVCGLTVTTTATNAGDHPLPFGAGFHPYLTVGTPLVDAATLHVPARTRLGTDARGIPTGEELPLEGSSEDFRSPRPIGDVRLDVCYTDLAGDPEGITRVTMAADDGRRSTSVWMDRSFSCVMVFTGDTLAPDRRRRGLAVEPMTCAPDAFNNGRGLRLLEPGEAFRGAWGIEPGQAAPGEAEG